MVGDVLDPKRNTMPGQDMPDRYAEGGPRKLDEGEHGGYMTEAKRNRKRQHVSVAVGTHGKRSWQVGGII